MQSIASASVSSTSTKTWSSRAEPVSARASSYRGTAVLMRSARRPVSPGHFLESRFMQPAGITQDALARAMGVSRRRVNELIRGRRSITPDTAIRLALRGAQREDLVADADADPRIDLALGHEVPVRVEPEADVARGAVEPVADVGRDQREGVLPVRPDEQVAVHAAVADVEPEGDLPVDGVVEGGRLVVLADDRSADRDTVAAAQAEADATSKKVAAYGGPKYQLTQQVMNRFAEAVEKSGIDLVPRVMVGGGSSSENANPMQALMTMLLAEKMGVDSKEPSGESALQRELRTAVPTPVNTVKDEKTSSSAE